MSRRSRRRGKAGGQGWLGKVALALIVVGVLGAAVLYAMVRGYLYSDGFRRFLSAKASAAANVEGEFTPFRWDGLAVDTNAFEATGTGLIQQVRMDGLHTEVGVSGLRRGVWEIRGSRLQRLEVAIDARKHGWVKQAPPPAAKPSGWLPHEVDVQGIDVREINVNAQLAQGPATVQGMRMRVEPAGKKWAYRIEVANGTIRLPFAWLPDLRVERARLRYQDGQLFLNEATAAAWLGGHLETSGEWDIATSKYSLGGAVKGVKCGDLFNENWAKRCSGDVSTEFTFDNHAGSPVARGRVEVLNGVLTALPVLDALAAYADTRRFRVLDLSEVHTDWRWTEGEFFLSKLVLASEGLARLEGNLFIRGRQLDGTFRLGLAPGTLATIPGAETHVFIAGERGLLWTPLRITGTLDDPTEDLTDRLSAAAGQRMFEVIPETGEKVLKYTRSLLGETPANAVDQGVKIIEDGTKTMRELGGIFEGILGGGAPPPEPPRKQPDPDDNGRLKQP